MKKWKIVRTSEEEKELKRMRLDKQAKNQCKHRNKTATIVQSTSNDRSVPSLEIQPEMGFIQEVMIPYRRNLQLEEEVTELNHRNIELQLRVQQRETDNRQEPYSSGKTELCIHCTAAHILSEKISNMRNTSYDCCSLGKVPFENLPGMPAKLHSFFNQTREKPNIFFERI